MINPTTFHRADDADTIDVLAAHRFDEARLLRYLAVSIPGFNNQLTVRQFQGGQSNPTYLLRAEQGDYVLRKKPPGELLPKAHQVEREYQVMRALSDSGVPVPQMCVLCEDDSVIGTPFFVMRYVSGAVNAAPDLNAFDHAARRPIYASVATTLATLHQLDWQSLGLAEFGRAEGYVARQIKTWSRQYAASQAQIRAAGAAVPPPEAQHAGTMDRLIEWLTAHLPGDDIASIVHGDYRVGNMIIDADARRIAAVIDWELSTIGHPLSDLGYLCMPYYLPANTPGIRGLIGVDLERQGIPEQSELVAMYCAVNPSLRVDDLTFYIVFSLFRMAAILHGIHGRAVQGNASNADALQVGERANMLATTGWDLAADRFQPRGK